MLVAGIRRPGGDVGMIDVPAPRPLAGDEVLIQVRAAGVGNWDEFVRTGDWDVGRRPPMALGVQAAGLVTAVGSMVTDWGSGDEVMTHPLPLRDQGTWAPALIAPSASIARKPAGVSWEAAAVFPVPALTAAQVLDEALGVGPGDRLLVNGAGGVTGRLLVALGSLRGAEVIATAGPRSRAPVAALAARHVIHYHAPHSRFRRLPLSGLAGSGAGDHRRHRCLRCRERHTRWCGGCDPRGSRRRSSRDHHLGSARTGPRDHGLERLRETGRRPAERPRAAPRGRTARDLGRGQLRASCRCGGA